MFQLIPKDEGFYDIFDRAASNAHEAAKLLVQFMTSFDDIEQRAKQVHNVEHTGDNFTREAIEKLNRTFITPFDREDIHELVCKIDDVIDNLDGAVQRMVLYKIMKPTDDAKKLADVLMRATKVIQDATPLLRNLKKPQEILNRCVEVCSLEAEGDRIEAHGIAQLFESTKDPFEVIKWKDIYGDLEESIDSCQDVVNVIRQIVIRHS